MGCDGGDTKDTKQGLCLADGGPARRDVSIGTAEVCLPTDLRAARLSEGTRSFETDGKSGSFRGCQEQTLNKQMKKGSRGGAGKIFGTRRPEDNGRAVINSDITDCEMISAEVSAYKKQAMVQAGTNQTRDASRSKTAVAWLVDALSPWSKPEEGAPSTAVHREFKNISGS